MNRRWKKKLMNARKNFYALVFVYKIDRRNAYLWVVWDGKNDPINFFRESFN